MHPPYSLDLTPNDYPLFLALQNFQSDKKLESREDWENRLLEFFANKCQDFYERGNMKLPLKWKNFKTVIYNRWLHRKKYLETGSVENKPRPSGPSKLISRAKRIVVMSATNKPMTSAQNIANELLSSCNVSVSTQTVRNVLHSAGLKARTPRKKPYISEVNRKRRLEFTMKYKNKPMDFWKKRHNLLDSAKKLSTENTFIFQQDHDPKHTAIVTKTWLLYYAPRRLETLPQSPDLNPIENFWMHLNTEVGKKI
ncbi:uncharacterized protein TNCV_1311781 [Trichonephila clavipes]|nr:uncharacterized protein TNCV_1311781 [Trichonephila clavipes]